MPTNQNQDSSSSMRFEACENSGVAPWLDLNHDILFLIMKQLEVVDFFAFNRVCKSWRSFTLSNKNKFMASKPPLLMRIFNHAHKKEWYCRLEDFEGKKFKTILPHFSRRRFVGLTCGHLVLYGEETNDFWLVNPITRHELHFPCSPFRVFPDRFKVILVFLLSINGWVFIVIDRFENKIWVSIAGKGAWNHVSPSFPIFDIHYFKGKIYTLHIGCNLPEVNHLCELRVASDPKPEIMLLETRNYPKPDSSLKGFVSSGENLYVMQCISQDEWKLHKLDFSEIKWAWEEKAIGEYAFFHSNFRYWVAIKSESWANHPRTQYERYAFFPDTPNSRIHKKCRIFRENIWYLLHDSLFVRRLKHL